METFKYYFNKTIITLCILFFFVLWYRILSKILCSVFCEVETAEVIEKLKAQRTAENEENSSTPDTTDSVNISSSR